MLVAIPISSQDSQKMRTLAFRNGTSITALAELAVSHFLIDPDDALFANGNDAGARLGGMVVTINDETMEKLEALSRTIGMGRDELLTRAVTRLVHRLQTGSVPLLPKATIGDLPPYRSEEYYAQCCADMLNVAAEEINRLMLPYEPSAAETGPTVWTTTWGWENFLDACEFYEAERRSFP